MTPWGWFWLEEGEPNDCWAGEHDTRDHAIAEAQRELPAGAAFFVIEARSSEDMKYEGADCVPFLRTRNKERLVNGPVPA
ncbi:MAG: hypothetical protein AB7O91_03980 [Sphingomonas sp.]